MRKDIRLLLMVNADNVFTRDGNNVKIIDFHKGVNRNLIYGHVIKNNKEIPHYWQNDGTFNYPKESPLDLFVK